MTDPIPPGPQAVAVGDVRHLNGQVTEHVSDDDPRGLIDGERADLGRLVYKRYFTSRAAYDNGAGTPAQTVHYTYDPLGRTQSVIDSESGTTTYAYDADGRVAQVANPQGVVNHAYDPATGRLVETWTGSSSRTTDTLYGYDELGRLASVGSALIAGSQPAAPAAPRDRFGASGSVAVAAAANPLPTTVYTYDAAGNLSDVMLPNGVTTHYAYDALNRLDVWRSEWRSARRPAPSS